MRLAALRLRQRDGITCGPTVAVVAGVLLDADYGAQLQSSAWFAAEQGRIHATVNLVWPRRLGTTPMGMARALSAHRVRYRWRPVQPLQDAMADVVGAVEAGLPVPMLIGQFIPRHWVLLVDVADGVFQCYEPSSGAVLPVSVLAIRRANLAGLGYRHPFAFVLPASS